MIDWFQGLLSVSNSRPYSVAMHARLIDPENIHCLFDSSREYWQGLTFVHLSAQHKHSVWGPLGGFNEFQ